MQGCSVIHAYKLTAFLLHNHNIPSSPMCGILLYNTHVVLLVTSLFRSLYYLTPHWAIEYMWCELKSDIKYGEDTCMTDDHTQHHVHLCVCNTHIHDCTCCIYVGVKYSQTPFIPTPIHTHTYSTVIHFP